MTQQVLIAGGGIGGLAAALAASRAGWHVRLYERATVLGEVGAGIQLGPNATRVLHAWGLQAALAQVAAWPDRLQVRDALSAKVLGELPLAQRALQRYGAPYATVHRADLHALLLQAAQARRDVWLNLGSTVTGFGDSGSSVTLQTPGGPDVEGDVLVGADGLWSRVRTALMQDGAPRFTGHLAYRAMVAQAQLPAHLRSQQVTAWLGPRLHVVQYPVRGGEWLNVVAIVHGAAPRDLQSWDHRANAADLAQALAQAASPLRALVEAVSDAGALPEGAWRLWPLCDRPPMRSAREQAQGRVVLLGDAAHPMPPYLAQGAGMALEDAAELGRVLQQARDPALDVPTLLQRYALNRWQRNARVQGRAQRNGRLFHATGLFKWARDSAMALGREAVLDMPWLYRG